MTTRLPTRLVTIFAAAIAAATLGLGAATAQDKVDFTFAYDLDRATLASPDGARRVYNDLRREAGRACRTSGSFHGLNAIDRDCQAELVDKVVALAGSHALSSRHQGSYLYARARRLSPDGVITVAGR
jgi:UrcA family protein